MNKIVCFFFIFIPVLTFSQGSLNMLTFDGVDDRITGTNGGLNAITNNFTMEMWVNPTATLTIRTETNAIGNTQGTSGQRYAVFPSHGGGSCPAAAGNAGLGISVGTNGIQVFEHKACQMPALLVYNATVPTGWFHIAVVVTAKQPSLYINGVLVRTGVTSNMNNVFPSAQLGTNIYGNYAGDIDEFRIWNTNISQAQIRDNMCLRLTGAEANLVRYYRFDEGAGTTLTDASSSSVNGTLTSGPVWEVSSAAIGNTSTYIYHSGSWAGVTIPLSSSEGDSIIASAISTTNIRGLHVYHVDGVPVNTTGITGLGGNDHYYGVYKARTTTSGGTYTATYHYRENDAYQNSSSVADPDYAETNLRVFTRSNNSTSSWTMNSTAPNTSSKTITLTAQSTEFILAYVNGLANLPVELINFSAYYENSHVNIEWQTSSETNNRLFIVERSRDGINFEEVFRKEGTGNSNTQITYSGKDLTPFSGVSYYRLKQIDFDGNFTYSQIRIVEPNIGLNNLLIYPNPNDGTFSVQWNGIDGENYIISVKDLIGREVYSYSINASSDYLNQTMNLNKILSAGTYLISVSHKNKSTVQKLVVR